MRGRTKIFSDLEVIDKAIDVFWNKGYEAASTDELLSAMGIGKGSFYNSFPGGKRELFEKSLDQFNQTALAKLRQQLQNSADPLEEVRAFFRSISTDRKQNHMKGCFLGNTIAELALVETELKGKAVKLLKQLEAVFFEALEDAQKKGRLQTKEDSKVLARYLITVWNGVSITRRMYPNQTDLQSLIELQLSIIQ
jgi:TetR/AcrR family transcriptional repressor of nem operon